MSTPAPGPSAPAADATAATAQVPAGRRRLWRRIVTPILIVVAVLVAVLAVPAHYVKASVLDTDGYLEIVGPLAADPEVQDAIATAITTQVLDQVDVEALVQENLETLAGRDRVPDRLTLLAPALTSQIEQLVERAADRLVKSQQFSELWIAANTIGHGEAINVLESQGRTHLDVEDGVVSVPLDGFLEKVRDALVERGLTRAENIQTTGHTIVLFESDDLATVQDAVRWFLPIAALLPFLVLILVGCAAWTAGTGRRMRTVGTAAVAVAVVMAALLVGLALARGYALGALPVGLQGLSAVTIVLDAFLAPLRSDVWWWLVPSVLVALVAFLGPWAYRSIRSATSRTA